MHVILKPLVMDMERAKMEHVNVATTGQALIAVHQVVLVDAAIVGCVK